MRSFQLSLRQQQEHWLCQLALHVPPSEHQDLRLFHVELDFQYWGCLQLHPENRIQSTGVYMHKEEVSKKWITWLELESDGLGED